MPLASSSFTGTTGAAWPAEWTNSRSTSGSSATIDTNRGKQTTGAAGGYSDSRADRLNFGTVQDGNLTGTFMVTSTAEAYPQIHFRADSTLGGASGTCYFLSLEPNGGNVQFYKRVSGTQTALSTGNAFTFTANTVYSWRVVWTGTSLQARIWTGAEPGTWNANITDSSITAAGYVGLAIDGGGPAASVSAYWDDIALGPVPFTSTESVTAGDSGATLMTGMTATEAVTAAGSAAGLALGVALGATSAVTASGDATLTVVSRIFTGALEVELTAGNWTDFSQRIAFSAGPVRIRQGRATEYDEVGAGTLTCTLLNDDGALMPENPSSPYFPGFVEGARIRWRVTKGGTTWTRFVGWIQAIEPDFPTSSTTGATVAVTAVDALGLLAQRRLRSSWTEAALALARANSTTVDAYEAAGKADGWYARLTNYSSDVGAASCTFAWGSSPNLSFGSDRDVSCGQVVTCSPDSAGRTNTTIPLFRPALSMQWLLHLPTSIPAIGTVLHVSGPHVFGGSVGINISVTNDGSGNLQLRVYDNAGSTSLGTLLSPAPAGQWVLMSVVQNAGNVARIDVTATNLGDGTAATASNIAVDMRSWDCLEFPTGAGATTACASGGHVGFGKRITLPWQDGTASGAQGTIAARLPDVQAALSTLPVSWATVGTLSTQVVTGDWASRYALDVLQELVRSGRALAWARSRDSVIHVIDAASLRPAAVLATVDSDADCAGAPRLSRSVDTRPTRVQVDAPGRSVLVVDSTAEAGPGQPQRAKTVSTVCAASADMTALGNLLLSQSAGLRITRLVIDLTTGATDHTATLFSEASTLSGLFPTARIRVTVPASHFGASTRDVWVQGWQEEFHPRSVTVTLDTTPAT